LAVIPFTGDVAIHASFTGLFPTNTFYTLSPKLFFQKSIKG